MFEKIVLASGNAGKLKEFSRLFADLNIEVLPQSQFNTPECPEPYHTFVENALAKARHAAKYSGLPALADDSGICTNALNGAPVAAEPAASTQPLPKVTLKQGMSHEAVAILREKLGAPATDGDSTYFDGALAEAVTAYQQSHGLKADGIVSGKTRNLLNGTPKNSGGNAPDIAALIEKLEQAAKE